MGGTKEEKLLAQTGVGGAANTSQSETADARREGNGQEAPRGDGNPGLGFDGAGGIEPDAEQPGRCAS